MLSKETYKTHPWITENERLGKEGLLSWDKALYGAPHIIHCDRLHTGAVGAALHLAQEEAWLPRRMPPDGDVPGVIERIGAIFLWARRTKDSDDRDVHSRRQVHRTAIIADEEIAAFELCRQFSKGGFAGQVDYHISWCMQFVLQLLIEGYISWPSNQENLRVHLGDEFVSQFLVAWQWPAFGGQFHAWIAAAAAKQGDAQIGRRAYALPFLWGWLKTQTGSVDGETDVTSQVKIDFGLVLQVRR